MDIKALVFDIETNGLLDELDTVHCMSIRSAAIEGIGGRFNNQGRKNTIEDGLRILMNHQQEGGYIVGHNIIKFDIPALRKVYPWFTVNHEQVLDTLVIGRLMFPDLGDTDTKLVRAGKLPKNLFKRHSLEAWGHRMGNFKGDFAGPWDKWTQEMDDYCHQDTDVCLSLFLRFLSKDIWWNDPEPVHAIRLEPAVARIISRQERFGFGFNTQAAASLFALLTQRKLDTELKMRAVFKPFYMKDGHEFVPKADNKRHGYVKGARVTKVKLVEFNPGSRDHVALVLKRRYGWVPTEFTNDGKAKIDETVLSGLQYPEAKVLSEYFMILKRIGQVATGNEAWLKKVGPDGRIHGAVTTNGAVTGRMTHAYPNVAQVPANRSPYGEECRSLFGVFTEGRSQVGADATALELCCLAGYMAVYDNGDYVRVVLEGKKEDGTDIHSVNARALGLDPKAKYFDGESGRDIAKTWFYAFIYGAGDEKLGFILCRKKGAVARKRGSASRAAFMKNLPALGKLVEAVKKAAQRGYLRGLDGRVIPVRSAHAALNTLLQSAGAVIMKQALVTLDNELTKRGFKNLDTSPCWESIDYEFLANVHDEWQIETRMEIAHEVGKLAVESIRLAGEFFAFRCPLSGDYAVGRTWADTH